MSKIMNYYKSERKFHPKKSGWIYYSIFPIRSAGLVAIFWIMGTVLIPTAVSLGQATMGAREVALGQSGTAIKGSLWSVFGNAALMDQNEASVSFFGIRYYGFASLTDMAAAISLPTKVGVVGAGVYRYGDDLFNESRIRIAYKNSFHGFHYGAVVNYNHVSIGGGYGSAGAFGLDVGIAAAITEGIWIGARATNINRPAYRGSDEELPREMSIGLSWKLSDVAFFSSDVVKDVRFPLSWRGGVEVTVFEGLQGRAGVSTKPRTFSLGFGYHRDLWGINVVVQRHENPVLGLSPGLDLSLSW